MTQLGTTGTSSIADRLEYVILTYQFTWMYLVATSIMYGTQSVIATFA